MDEYTPPGKRSAVSFVVVVVVVVVIVDEDEVGVVVDVSVVDDVVVNDLRESNSASPVVFKAGTCGRADDVVAGAVSGCVSAKRSPSSPQELLGAKPPVIRMAPVTMMTPRTTGI